MIVLGIESSCDETSVGIVKNGDTLLACSTASSMNIHAKYGGVVPEIAAREHIQAMTPTLKDALNQSGLNWKDIDAIAVTNGAGLGGSLLIGVLTARTLAITKNKPLYACNHVEGHVYANFLTKTALSGYNLPKKQPNFPLLALIVSGGHTQLVLFQDHFNYQLLGQTHDDAIGEAFDKVAKILGLPYPGGPSIAKSASGGNPHALQLPKARMENRYDFSFSGLKTAVLRATQNILGVDHTFESFRLAERLNASQRKDISASFQRVAIETVVDKTLDAFRTYAVNSVVIAGGVASNLELRHQLSERLPIDVEYTDPKLCTDNGAMIATLGCFKMKCDQPTTDPNSLDIEPNLSM
ncbi:MAG: tRNA (adenosine(37)-N6)-threonylcarbamoyltransferase complex transferase subunit TsaD [Candidatus Saccharimonadales bacterium]